MFSVYTPANPPKKRPRRANKPAGTSGLTAAAPTADYRPPLAPTSANNLSDTSRVEHHGAHENASNMTSETIKLSKAVDMLKDHGYKTVFEFMDAYLGADDPQQKAAATRLINNHGTKLLDHLHARRPALVEDWMASVNAIALEKEVKALSDRLRPQYGTQVSHILSDFSIDKLLKDASEVAPTLCSGLRSAGAMPDDMEDDTSRKEYRVVC